MKKEPKEFIILNKKQITPNMLRVSLVGKNLGDLSSNEIGGYVKLHFSCKKNNKCLTKVGEDANSITNWDENHFTEKASKYIFSKFMD